MNYRKDEKDGLRQTNEYKYYDEREWRFVPDMEKNEDYLIPIEKKNEDTFGLSKKTKDKMCKFEYGDIKYIIVNKQDDKVSLMEYIGDLSGCNKNEKEELSSKIIVWDIIKNDI